MYQLDVKSAFLNGPLEEKVYVKQPLGFEKHEKKDQVYRLKNALYGLKQAPRAQNKRIGSFLIQLEFTRCTSEHGVYVQQYNRDILILCLYVDELLVIGNENEMMGFKKCMMKEFEMSELGRLSYFLGMEFTSTNEGILLHQKKYAEDILKDST